MLNNKTIAVVVPSYNEAEQIQMVIGSMPIFVDRIIIVNDCSSDGTSEVVERYIDDDKVDYSNNLIRRIHIESNVYNKADLIVQRLSEEEVAYFTPFEVINKKPNSSRIILINHKKNGGVGAAIATGYKWCKDMNISCTAVMAGDGQMDPSELEGLCLPVVKEGIDYVKGNRLSHKSAKILIPKTRFFGNSILSILTKIASGYWHVSDTQTGYTAISLNALNLIELYKIYPRYGMPNDMLVKLNVENCTLKEIPIKPVYQIGEQSKMNVRKVIPKISWLLTKSFFYRIRTKYFKRSFHPLFILYFMGLFLILLAIPYGFKILLLVFKGLNANPITVLAFAFLFISGFQSLLFAMWMDIQDNERLNK